MPYDYSIDPATRTVSVRSFGDADLASTLAIMRRVAGDPQHEPEFAILLDARTSEYVATFADALRIRDAFLELRDAYRGPIAVVVVDALRYGVARTVAGMIDLFGIRLQAFRDMHAAHAWLAEQAPADDA